MADVFTKKKRSEIMSRIRSKNTLLENGVFSYLRKRKIYFRKHYDKVYGKPDLALPRRKVAIFIDGDFWHGYKFIKLRQRLPRKYWTAKIKMNILRDKGVNHKLRKEGWTVVRIWEHEVKKDPAKALEKIASVLGKS